MVATQVVAEVIEVQAVTVENTDKYKCPEEACSVAVTSE